ncbi:sensor histidine kinase [Crocinitomix algicola]|uniref:sensor histidine kinase n=1 Tax=Crocinitomix algicola TaxID=1740263 RepID=UPI0008727B64|nr:sensor histidine kinase [Crocinitomix algicola]
MQHIFTPPQTTYKNTYDQDAFDLTWRYNAFMSFLYLLLILAGGLNNIVLFLGGLGCWLTPITSLFILHRTRKYKFVAYLQVTVGTIATGIILNLNIVHVHSIEIVYMLLVVLYAFLVLGSQIGMISISVQLFWFILYFLFAEPKTYEPLTLVQSFSIVLTIAVGTVLFGFLILQFLKLREKSENKYLSINKDLNEINHLVNLQYHEKTVMLKEIHHRVKNNLQVISSLLRLQVYEIEEEELKAHFQDAIHRVSAMALIHEKMYQNENLSKINIKNYINTLAEELISTHAHETEINLEVSSSIYELGNDTLVPLALLINELIVNTLKHAFEGESQGRIKIQISRINSSNRFQFIYADSGVWKECTKPSSFGLELISTLTEQLEGEMERKIENGTVYSFVLTDLV